MGVGRDQGGERREGKKIGVCAVGKARALLGYCDTKHAEQNTETLRHKLVLCSVASDPEARSNTESLSAGTGSSAPRLCAHEPAKG